MKTKNRFYKLTAWFLALTILMTFIPTTLTASVQGGVASADSVPVVTEVKFNSDSLKYDESTKTFYVSDTYPFVLTVIGENLTLFNEMGGLQALFKGDALNSGWTIVDMNVHSDTEVKYTIDTSTLAYLFRNSFGSSKFVSVMVENRGTRHGNIINVNIVESPTYEIKIKNSAGGTVEHNNFFSNYIASDTPVNLTITPDNGYMLESLKVGGADVTNQVTDNTYAFVMPEEMVEVEATFKLAPITYTVTVSADKTEATVGETVTLSAQVKANGNLVHNAVVSWEAAAGAELHSDDALTASVTPESAGEWIVAALYDPTPEDNENGDAVSGSITVTLTNPATPAITDVVISGDAVTRDEVNKTYTVRADAVITVTVSGTDLDKITDEDYANSVYSVGFFENTYSNLSRDKYDAVSGNFVYDITADNHLQGIEITYSNDGGVTRTKTGWKLVIERPVTVYKLYVGGEVFTSEKLTISDRNGGTAVYTPETNTLTLNNYSYSGDFFCIAYYEDDGSMLNLVLNGDNSLTATPSINGENYSAAVICQGEGLTISGDGSLDVKAGDGSLTEHSDAIYADFDITIKGGKITATTGKTNNGGANAIASQNGKIIIDGGTVIANGGEGKKSAGITAGGNIIINGGNVTAKGGKVDDGNDIGIHSAGGSITVNGGNVVAIGGESADSTGMFSYNPININGGVVTAEGKYAAIYSYDSVSVGDGLGVYNKNGEVIENPDFDTLTYAKFDVYTEEKYTLTWSNGDGGSYEQKIARGTIISVPDNEFFNDTMNKTGYTLTGWTNVDGFNVGDAMPAKDLTFSAQYTANAYTVTFNPNGGNAESVSVVTVDGKLESLPEPTRSGYSFNGWFDAETDGNRITTDTLFAEDTTIYAQWIKNISGGGGITKYTVKFDTNGGTSVANKSVSGSSKLTVPAAPEKDGFIFEGWYTDEQLSIPYDFDSKVTKSLTLYAKWSEALTEDGNNSGTFAHNCPSLKFDDLDTTQWYHFDTDYVIENGIFRGMAEKIFEPHTAQTRAMMITVLYRVEGEPLVNRSIPFADVDMGAYYANAVIWGQQNGIIKGYSETEFGPDDNITREQIAAIMHRFARYKGINVSIGENTNILSYEDFDDISEYAISAMQWAVGSGLIKGRTESTLNPLENATRAEIAAILHRFAETYK